MNVEKRTKDLHQYSALFYRYQREGSARSAAQVLPLLRQVLPFRSVLDVGCGAGAWLSAHQKLGVQDVLGVDGDYVDRSLLMVPARHFLPQDITQKFDLGRTFDLVQCLEVAEHIQPAASDALVDNLVRHGQRVLFSAAVPGQGGEDHINEQAYEYWRDRFALRGYRLFDFLRPKIMRETNIEPWYRLNLLLFVHDSTIPRLDAGLRSTRIADQARVADFSPPGYRLRKALLRQLPISTVTALARWKHQRAVRSLAQG
jgi:SAM-dependent methyltransferase